MLYTVGRTLGRGSVRHNAANYTQNKRADIHASSGILTPDHSVREGEDNLGLRPGGHCDRPYEMHIFSLWFYSPILGLGLLHETFRFISVTRSRTVGRTPSTGDQLVARTLLTARVIVRMEKLVE
jgi:hypothetical protein